jgi:MFS family permease
VPPSHCREPGLPDSGAKSTIMPSLIASYLRSYGRLGRNAKLYLISNTIQALSAGAAGVLYILYLSALHYGTNFIGLTLFAGVVGAGIAIPPASPLVARLGWKRMLLWSDWIGGVAIVIQLVIPVAPLILLSTVAVGASFAIVLIVNTPLLTAYSPAEERTAVFGLGSALGLVAAVLGTQLAGRLEPWFASAPVAHSGLLQALTPLLVPVVKARPYELAMLATGALSIPSIIPIYLMEDERHSQQTHALPPANVSREPLRTRLSGWVRLGIDFAGGVVGRFSLTQALLGFGAGLFVPYLSLYFVNHLHVSVSFFSDLAATYTVLQAITALLSASLARRFGEVRGSVLVQFGTLPFLLGLAFGPVVAIIAVCYLVRGSLISMAGPPLQTFLMGAVPEERRVVASEAFNVTWQIAGAVGVALGGEILQTAGYTPDFLIAAACYAMSALLLMVWFGRRERPGKPDVAEQSAPTAPTLLATHGQE